MKCRAALHDDRCARVVGQHKHRRVIGRIVAPPSLPAVVGPGSADRTEHVASQNPGADVLKSARGEAIVEPGGAVPLAEHGLKGAGRKYPLMQGHAAYPE